MVVDDNDYVIGMISLSDILSFLTLKPVALEREDLAAAAKAKEAHTLVEESEGEEVTSEEEEEDDTQTQPTEMHTAPTEQSMETTVITVEGEEKPLNNIGDDVKARDVAVKISDVENSKPNIQQQSSDNDDVFVADEE